MIKTEIKPEPLDFDFKNFFERFKEVYNTLKKDLGWEREFEEFIKDIKNLEEDINDCESSVLDYEYCVKLSMYYMYLKVKSACEFFLQGIDDLYHKMGKPEVWRMNKDELVDACEDYVKEKFKIAFKDVLEKGDNQ